VRFRRWFQFAAPAHGWTRRGKASVMGLSLIGPRWSVIGMLWLGFRILVFNHAGFKMRPTLRRSRPRFQHTAPNYECEAMAVAAQYGLHTMASTNVPVGGQQHRICPTRYPKLLQALRFPGTCRASVQVFGFQVQANINGSSRSSWSPPPTRGAAKAASACGVCHAGAFL